jgi:hypothetical protein
MSELEESESLQSKKGIPETPETPAENERPPEVIRTRERRQTVVGSDVSLNCTFTLFALTR